MLDLLALFFQLMSLVTSVLQQWLILLSIGLNAWILTICALINYKFIIHVAFQFYVVPVKTCSG